MCYVNEKGNCFIKKELLVMDNNHIAQFFYKITEYLELKGENPFKIRAYSNAARIIESHTKDLSKITDIVELRKIKGIGESIAEKIVEINKTGKCSYLEELEKEIPKGLLDITTVPGIGPKKAAFLYKEKKIKSVDELKKYAEKGKLHDLKGFGEKTEENILKGIEVKDKFHGRMTIGQALPAAKEIINYLSKKLKIKQITEAGSLRRRREDIGDIDILASSDDNMPAKKIMDAFTASPFVKEVLAKGGTKSAIISHDDVQVDIRVVEKESFGAALQYFTGSKQHNIILRQYAEGLGFKVNEYGVFRLKDNKKVAGETEESVYKALGLPLIPVPIRETGEEIELALKGKLPKLVEKKDIRGDLHFHTVKSDGFNTIEEIVKDASAFGYEYIALTDHSQSLKVAHGVTEKDKLKQIETIRKLNEKNNKFKILAGAEVDILKYGDLDYPGNILKKLDIVVASVHSYFKFTRKEMTDRIIKAIKNPNVDIIAHPTGRLFGTRDEVEADWDEVFKAAAYYNTALEINSFPNRLDLKDIYCRRAKEFGVLFAISTDGHNTNQLEFIEYGINVAQRGWLTAKDIINTKSYSDLIKWLNRGQALQKL